MIFISFVQEGREQKIEVEIDEDNEGMQLDDFRNYLTDEKEGEIPASFNFLNKGISISLKQESEYTLKDVITSSNQINLKIKKSLGN